jgi:hypothetical protein
VKRILVVATFVLLMVLPTGSSSALGKTPQGSCPPRLEGPIAISSLDPELQEFATFIDTEVGGNGDGKVCIGTIAPGTPGEGLNILDNRVAGF